jgi:hypothetical protein
MDHEYRKSLEVKNASLEREFARLKAEMNEVNSAVITEKTADMILREE